MVNPIIDVVPTLAPVIISKPSLKVVTIVTLFGAALTTVILEILIRRREKSRAAQAVSA